MPEIEDWKGPLEKDPEREHVYHSTLESILIKKKRASVSTRYITRLERRVNIHNYLHPSIVQVENHLTIDYRRYCELKKDALKLI